MTSEETTTVQENRLFQIHKKITDDVLAADLQFSFLVSAQRSYRHDTVLKPFPPMFMKDTRDTAENHDNRRLDACVGSVPQFSELVQNGFGDIDKSTSDLLLWCLDTAKFQLCSCPKSKYADIEKLTEQCVSVPAPNHVFEVQYNPDVEAKWLERRGNQKLHYGFHGSKLENFHSILHYGLQSHLSKTALFGEGTYLSGELSVSMPYAPTGTGWNRSRIGHMLSCVAVCEIIDDPSVKCQIKGSDSGTNRARARASGSMGGDVPERYYVVQNNEMMRVKFLLVYATSSARKTMRPESSWKWIQEHKFVLLMVLYILVLAFVGLHNSKAFKSFLKKYWR